MQTGFRASHGIQGGDAKRSDFNQKWESESQVKSGGSHDAFTPQANNDVHFTAHHSSRDTRVDASCQLQATSTNSFILF